MNHPDFILIAPENGVIKIDRIRKMCRDLGYPPYESEMRVVVIEDVHTMRREAANSLLKTLEEPPENNLLILTAESSQEILSTLISRCQVIPFSNLSISHTVDLLVQAGTKREDAELLANFSEGSPGKARLFKEQEMVPLWRELTSFLADPTKDPDRDVGELLRLAEQMAKLKENLVSFLGLLRIWLRDLLMGDGRSGAVVQQEDMVLKSWSSNELFAKLQAIDKAERELSRNCNRNLVCEVLLFTIQ